MNYLKTLTNALFCTTLLTAAWITPARAEDHPIDDPAMELIRQRDCNEHITGIKREYDKMVAEHEATLAEYQKTLGTPLKEMVKTIKKFRKSIPPSVQKQVTELVQEGTEILSNEDLSKRDREFLYSENRKNLAKLVTTSLNAGTLDEVFHDALGLGCENSRTFAEVVYDSPLSYPGSATLHFTRSVRHGLIFRDSAFGCTYDDEYWLAKDNAQPYRALHRITISLDLASGKLIGTNLIDAMLMNRKINSDNWQDDILPITETQTEYVKASINYQFPTCARYLK